MDRTGRAPLSEFCWEWLKQRRPAAYTELLDRHVQSADFRTGRDRLGLFFPAIAFEQLPPETAAGFDRQADHQKGATIVIDCPEELFELFLDFDPVSKSHHQELAERYAQWLAQQTQGGAASDDHDPRAGGNA